MAMDPPRPPEDDPDRTDVLPVLEDADGEPGDGTAMADDRPATAAADDLAAEDPTVVAQGLELTQPRLAQMPSPEERTLRRLAEERDRADAASAALDAARATIAGLEDRQTRLVAELESLRQFVPAAELEPLRAQLELMHAAVAEHEAERYGWREARDAAFEDVKRLSAELAAADVALGEVRREHAALGGALIRARTSLAERDAEIAALREQLAGDLPRVAEPAPVPSLMPLAGTLSGVVRLGLRTRVGRADDNELVLDTPSVSRHHAIVIASPRGVFVEDLNSANGLYVNRRRVRQAKLGDGDVVAFGGASFRYSGPEATAS
jgi:hypothetical protein